MTKRTLLIIIGLLVLLDVAAIIIYLAGTKNHDGKSPLDFTIDKSNEVTHADTIPDKASRDDFETIKDTVNFISTDKVQDGGEMKRMTSTVIIDLSWPKTVNGKTQFPELQNELMKKLTGKTYISVKQMVTDLITHPKFIKPTTHSTVINKDFSASRGASQHTQSFTMRPHAGSHYRLEIWIENKTFNGGSESSSLSIVHYDRQKGEVITINKIFDNASSREIRELVNQGIESKIIKENVDMREVESIPSNFVLGKDYTTFYVEQGGKRYEVKVSNNDLNPYFTDYYKELILNDTKLIMY